MHTYTTSLHYNISFLEMYIVLSVSYFRSVPEYERLL